MAKVLVTGGFGTIGRWLLAALQHQGHQVSVLELDTPRTRKQAANWPAVQAHWADLRDPQAVAKAVEGHEVVIHMAFVLTPFTERDPQGTHAVNVGGTQNVLAACAVATSSPRLLFCSSVEVFGHNRHLPGPRSIQDAPKATSHYTAQKIECEQRVRESGLDYAIVRFGAVIDIALNSSHELMFEFPLDVRFEVLHPADAALAVANCLTADGVWGRGALLLLAGGPSCQTTYGAFLDKMLTTMGVGPLPKDAFTTKDYASDWMDTAESQKLLQYQNNSLDDICRQVEALLGWRKLFLPLAKPFVRKAILAKSPYLGFAPKSA